MWGKTRISFPALKCRFGSQCCLTTQAVIFTPAISIPKYFHQRCQPPDTIRAGVDGSWRSSAKPHMLQPHLMSPSHIHLVPAKPHSLLCPRHPPPPACHYQGRTPRESQQKILPPRSNVSCRETSSIQELHSPWRPCTCTGDWQPSPASPVSSPWLPQPT